MKLLKVKRVVETISEFPNLGNRIKQARQEARTKDRKSLTDLCKESGISRAYWYQLENEDLRSPATEEIIRKIEKVLGIDLEVKFDD